jgi:hypothetical protein
VAALLAVTGCWPFNGKPTTESQVASPSLMQFLIGDRIMLGMVRLLLLAVAAFALASLAAFLSRGRWLKALSAKGWDVDERQEASGTIGDFEAEIDQVTRERDEALRELEGLTTEARETIEEAEEEETPYNADHDEEGDDTKA